MINRQFPSRVIKSPMLTTPKHEAGLVGESFNTDLDWPPRHILPIGERGYTALCDVRRNEDGTPIDWGEGSNHSLFQQDYKIGLLTYSINDMSSLQYLEELYQRLPTAPYGVDGDVIEYGKHPKKVGVQGIQILDRSKHPKPPTLSYTPLSQYTLFLVGMTPRWHKTRPREVLPGDLQDFLKDKPNIRNAGEVDLQNLDEIDAVFDGVIREFHSLLERSIIIRKKTRTQLLVAWLKAKLDEVFKVAARSRSLPKERAPASRKSAVSVSTSASHSIGNEKPIT